MNGQKENGTHKAVRKSNGKSHGVGTNIEQKFEMVRDAMQEGGEKVMEVGAIVDKKVKENPWLFLTGAALLALSVGYIIGGSRRA